MRGDGCDQHCVASQPVRRLEISTSVMPVMPASGRPLRIGGRSPGSGFGQFQSEIADSLRRTFEKLPFLGDCGRRPGSICTAWPSLQCNSPNSPLWPPASWECRARSAAPMRSRYRLWSPIMYCVTGAALVSQKGFNGQFAPWYAHHYINELV